MFCDSGGSSERPWLWDTHIKKWYPKEEERWWIDVSLGKGHKRRCPKYLIIWSVVEFPLQQCNVVQQSPHFTTPFSSFTTLLISNGPSFFLCYWSLTPAHFPLIYRGYIPSIPSCLGSNISSSFWSAVMMVLKKKKKNYLCSQYFHLLSYSLNAPFLKMGQVHLIKSHSKWIQQLLNLFFIICLDSCFPPFLSLFCFVKGNLCDLKVKEEIAVPLPYYIFWGLNI